MGLLVPKEVGEFFARATQAMDDVESTLTAVRQSAQSLALIVNQINEEVAEWRRLRVVVQAALGAAAKRPDA